MSDPKPTVYHADPHTRAKHQILEAYLARWLPILDRSTANMNRPGQRLLYFDGFAGAGEYEGQVPGSPQVPIDVVESHAHEFKCPVEVRLVEKRTDRVTRLRDILKQKKAKLLKRDAITICEPVEGDCEEEAMKLISECQAAGRSLGPAFFFLDQFGYSSFSMGLVRAILEHSACETFSYLNWSLLFPFMTHEQKHAGISTAFGGDEWREVLDLTGQQKEIRFRDIYMAALKQRGGAKYVYPFAMRGPDDRVIYWLFFCTNHIRGLEEMKCAMWAVDRSGGFEFSDKFASEHGSLFSYNDEQLANDLVAELNGRELTVTELFEHALVNTPACKPYGGMKVLERSGGLRPVFQPEGRRKGSFKKYPDMRVRIEEPIAQEPSLSLFDDVE